MVKRRIIEEGGGEACGGGRQQLKFSHGAHKSGRSSRLFFVF